MNIDKNYFLTRLANGEDMDAIGQELANMMNEAVAEYGAKIEAEKKTEIRKRELINDIFKATQEYATLEGLDSKDLVVSEEDMDMLTKSFSELFMSLREMKAFLAEMENTKSKKINCLHKSDEDILAEFVKMLS